MRMVRGLTTSGRNGMGVWGDEGEWQVCNGKGRVPPTVIGTYARIVRPQGGEEAWRAH